MRPPTLYSLLALSVHLLPGLAQGEGNPPPGADRITDSAHLKQLVHYWADFRCVSLSDHSEQNVKEQCKKACFPGGVTSDVPPGKVVLSSQTCVLADEEYDYTSGKRLTEEERKQHKVLTLTPGYCVCDDPLVNFAGDFFVKGIVEAGKAIQKVMCPALTALDLVVEIGSAAIPGVGKAITVGMRTGIKTAKMFQHAYNAQDAAMEWASMFVDQGFGLASEAGCPGTFKFSKADLAKRFLDFANAPDQLVPGINYDEMPCPKGKKASKKCKEKNGDRDEPQSPSKPNDDKPSKPTDTNKPQKSEPAHAKNVDCAAIGRNDLDFLEDKLQADQKEPTKRRATTRALRARRLEARGFSTKSGVNVCEGKRKIFPAKSIQVRAKPSWSKNNALAFGFNTIDDCSDYSWGEQTKFEAKDYDTEHVLEWSMVKNFFTVLNDHPDFKDKFVHPDPEWKGVEVKGEMVKSKVDFCTYWGESWDWPATLEMSDPAPAAPAPPAGQPAVKQTPFKWLAEAYPFIDGKSANARKAHENELVLLQKRINEHPKNAMFSINPKQVIYDDDDMKDLIKGENKKKHDKDKPTKNIKKGDLVYPEPHEQPRVAVQRCRSVVGAYRYMKEPKIDKIFIDQVNRIGSQLENLEKALAQNPRTKKRDGKADSNGVIPKIVVSYNKWQPQKLKEKWFAYMDEVYKKADDKAQKFMKTNIKRLKDEFPDSKKIAQKTIDDEKDQKKKDDLATQKKLRDDMDGYISKLEAEWNKAKDWEKPAWNKA